MFIYIGIQENNVIVYSDIGTKVHVESSLDVRTVILDSIAFNGQCEQINIKENIHHENMPI